MKLLRRLSSRQHGAPTVVLMYHHVADLAADPLALNTTPARFREHLASLRDLAEVVPVADVLHPHDRPRVAVTFDDAYANNAEIAAPILREFAVPATFFATTEPLRRDAREFWWDELAHAVFDGVASATWLTMRLPSGRTTRLDVRSAAARQRAFRWLNSAMLYESPTIQRDMVDQVVTQMRPTAAHCDVHRRLDADELRALHDEGLITIGAHTRSHACLAALADVDADAEILGSRHDLAAVLGVAPTQFAYPYGSPRTVRRTHWAMAAAAGFTMAFTTDSGVVADASCPTAIPRVAVFDTDGPTFRDRVRQYLR